MKRLFASFLLALCLLPGARADEGMWLIQCLDQALEKNMKARGLKLSAREIYNEEAGGLSDAIVSLGFSCTGSMISDDGLLITNHHCAYSDISAISTPECNHLEKGYWALSRDLEIPLNGKEFYFLKRVLEVTDEVNELIADLESKGLNHGTRRISYLMEKKYKQQTGLEASLSPLWAGEQYYMCLYVKYTDVRLVAAPPVSVAAFGGDEDNWEWPQHKADFAIYRVYDDNGEPLHPSRHLQVSRAGYKEGDFAMVIGYPGRTNRYCSAAELNQTINVERPVSNRLRARQMEIIRKWMDADPAVRIKYSDPFFSLSNVAELQEGEVTCVRRFKVIQQRQKQEEALRQDPRYSGLMTQLDAEYASISELERQKVYYRETQVRGLFISRYLLRMGSAKDNMERKQEILDVALDETDPRVEKELLTYSLQEFLTHIDPQLLQPIHKELIERFGTDYKGMSDWLWDNSCVSTGVAPEDIQQDPLYRFVRELSISDLNDQEEHVANLLDLRHAYTRARYQWLKSQGVAQYPDANSTMRLTYGRVKALEPHDGVYCHWQSTALGLYQKYNPANYDFCYPDAFRATLPPPNFPVNFLTDLDITGGNSGSPVLNAKGELIGLAFDGNKESLSSDYQPIDGYNMCVCVDIRYVLWILQEYAGLDYILKEINCL